MGFFSFLSTSAGTSKYASLVNYFKENTFGSEPPVMTILSNLPPKDRCAILEEVLKTDPTNINVYDKLSMAYLKSNNLSAAHNCLEKGRRSGSLSSQNYTVLKGKIDAMNQQFGGVFNSSTNYAQALQGVERNFDQFSGDPHIFGFVGIISAFCRSQMK